LETKYRGDYWRMRKSLYSLTLLVYGMTNQKSVNQSLVSQYFCMTAYSYFKGKDCFKKVHSKIYKIITSSSASFSIAVKDSASARLSTAIAKKTFNKISGLQSRSEHLKI
jgi:hypothetical protein